MTNNTRIVITGMGPISGLGLGIEDHINSIKKNIFSVRVKEDFQEYNIGKQYYSYIPDFHIKNVLKLKPPFPEQYVQLALYSAFLALNDSKVNESEISPFDIGCIMHTNFGPNKTIEKYLERLFSLGPSKVRPFEFSKTTINAILGSVARTYNLKGPSTILLGENSLGYSIDCIKNKKAKVMLIGGVDHIRELHLYSSYHQNLLFCPTEDHTNLYTDPNLSAASNRYIVGEGTCFLVIEDLQHAINRNATIYAEIIDNQSCFNKNGSLVLVNKSADDIQYLYNKILERNKLTLENIDLLIGSSCLPPQMINYDLQVLKDIKSEIYYTSMVSKTGECYSGSSGLSIALGVISIKNNLIPGTGYEMNSFPLRNPCIKVPPMCIEGKPNSVIVNSVHLGGNVEATLIMRYTD